MKKQQRSDNLASSLTECIDQIAATAQWIPTHERQPCHLDVVKIRHWKYGVLEATYDATWYFFKTANDLRLHGDDVIGWMPTSELSEQALKTTEKPNEHS